MKTILGVLLIILAAFTLSASIQTWKTGVAITCPDGRTIPVGTVIPDPNITAADLCATYPNISHSLKGDDMTWTNHSDYTVVITEVERSGNWNIVETNPGDTRTVTARTDVAWWACAKTSPTKYAHIKGTTNRPTFDTSDNQVECSAAPW